MSRLMKLLRKSPHTIAALFWPKFSVSSFKIVSGLLHQDILPKSVIDVGANVGQFAVASAKLFPDVIVYSFEPNPESVRTLKKYVNSLQNVLVYPIGLGDKTGELNFHVNSHSHSSSILPLSKNHSIAFPNAKEMKVIQIEVSTLDDVFSDIELPSPVLLKLDVQGYEAQVLRGGVETLKRVNCVILESSFKPLYEGEILFMEIVRLMEGYGFVFKRPVGWLNDPNTDEIIQIDALFQRG